MKASGRRSKRRFREIAARDVPDLFAVRAATRQNALSRGQLARLGITPESVLTMLRTTHRGWLCEEDGRIVGFAMGNGKTGEMWVVAVLPDCEGQGIGANLLTRVEEWLGSRGWPEIWLTTDIDTTLRAYGFYRRQGWIDHGVNDGLRTMKKTSPRRDRLRDSGGAPCMTPG